MTTVDLSSARTRSSRGRAIVVGSAEPMRELTTALRRALPRVSECTDLYRAIDDVGSSSAREPVALVVIAADCEGFDAAACADAFRRVDPSVQLVLAVSRAQEDAVAGAIAEGFEDSLSVPSDAAEIRAMLESLGLAEPTRRGRDSADHAPAAPHSATETPRVPEVRNVVELAIKDAQARASAAKDAPDTNEPAFEATAPTMPVLGLEPASTPAAHDTLRAPQARGPRAPSTPTAAPHAHAPTSPSTAGSTRDGSMHPGTANAGANPRTAPSAAAPMPSHSQSHSQANSPTQHASNHPTTLSPAPHPPTPAPQGPAARTRLPRSTFTMPPIRRVEEKRAADGPPGDLDLVAAMLEGASVCDAAMRVVHHHLGSSDIRFVPAPRPGEEAAVEHERQGLHQARVETPAGVFGALLSGSIGAATLSTWSAWLAQWLLLEETHRNLHGLAFTDELTGAGNRRAFDRVCADAIVAALAERRSFSLMFFDLDDFKQYNDRHGHEAGDEVLRETVELLQSCIRRGDRVFRIGGDEFVVLFCDASGPRNGGSGVPESVESIATRFQRAVADLRFPNLGLDGPGTLSISAGVAVFPWEGTEATTLLRKADLRALESKRAGKNVITFGPTAPTHGP